MVKGISNALDHTELCLVLQAEELFLSEIGFYSLEINLLFNTEFSVSNFSLLTYSASGNGIFRWKICYLLVLISNPDSST